MSGIKPARRWQPAFYPFKKETFGKRFLAGTERIVKGVLFGCRMCGNCLLQETAFICPMECPKGMRNGPCGGTTPEKNCYVEPSRKCIWYAIYDRAFRTCRQEKLLEVLPPVDWGKAGNETWGDVIKQVRKTGTTTFLKGVISKNTEKRIRSWDSVFRTVRQPAWWNGDGEYHKAGYPEAVSEFERQLRSGKFIVATEVSPPIGSGTDKLLKDINLVKPFVSAINFTDSSSARPKMSSIACSSFAARNGIDPVVQIASRDTTRTGLQANAIGLNSLGIYNVLCITGDNARTGDPPYSDMNIVDIDSVQMLWILRKMRDEGTYLDGRAIKNPPRYFLGAASSPFASTPEFQALKDQKKMNAGAQFFQTNLIFEPDRLDPWLEQLYKRNVTGRAFILIGIAPLRSYKIAEYLHTSVPGVKLTDRILERMKKAGESAPEEGMQIVLEIIQKLKGKQGINGIHIMSLGWESSVGRIVRESGL